MFLNFLNLKKKKQIVFAKKYNFLSENLKLQIV